MRKSIFSYALLAAVVALSACSNGAKEAEKTIRDFGKAVSKKDFAESKKLLTKSSQDIWEIATEMAGDQIAEESKDIDKQKIECNVKDDKGVCTQCCNKEGKADSIYMAKEDGKWKIDLAADPRMKEAKASIEKAGGKEKLMEQMRAMKKMMEEMKNMQDSSGGSAMPEMPEADK